MKVECPVVVLLLLMNWSLTQHMMVPRGLGHCPACHTGPPTHQADLLQSGILSLADWSQAYCDCSLRDTRVGHHTMSLVWHVFYMEGLLATVSWLKVKTALSCVQSTLYVGNMAYTYILKIGWQMSGKQENLDLILKSSVHSCLYDLGQPDHIECLWSHSLFRAVLTCWVYASSLCT